MMVRSGGWESAEAREAKEARVLEAVLGEKAGLLSETDGGIEPIPVADLGAMVDLDASTIGFAVESLCLAGLLERVDDGAAVQPTQGAARFWVLSNYMR